ncbi:hypothetical protein CL689_06500 [Candidatus Saccharibacteria bacterium]|nr:hypothetical protein [Candidatus Saccharibacteria bacterium]
MSEPSFIPASEVTRKDRVIAEETESLFLPEWEVESTAPKPSPETLIPENYTPEVLPPTGEPLRIEVDYERAFAVLDALMEAYEKKALPYSLDRVRLPHDPRHMPKFMERGSVDHANFLFNVCYYMRGGIKSNDAVKRMAAVFDQRPDLFIPEVARDASIDEIIEVLSANGLGFQKTVAGQWVENARRLAERYDGDPRRIFDDVRDYETSQQRIQNDGKGNGFLGFQEKMTSMIIYYLADDELIEPFNFPIPVDLHVMRVSIANKMVQFPDAPFGTNLFTKETLATLRQLYYRYAVERGVNPLRLCDAVWLLSESSCGRHPGNTTIEPLRRQHRNGRSTYLIPKVVDERDPAQRKAYAESCAVCPVQETCEYNIPGTQYYVGGNLIIRGERRRFDVRPIDSSSDATLF